VAGTDTTRSTISAAIHNILEHPEVHAKVLEELNTSGWDPKDPRSYTPSGTARLSLTLTREGVIVVGLLW